MALWMSISVVLNEGAKRITPEDIGEVVDEAEIVMKDGSRYLVTRRDSGQIQISEQDTDEKVYVKDVLIQYMDENGWGKFDSKLFNTRVIGKRFFEKYLNNYLL